MSAVGRWSLGIGAGLLVVAVAARMLDLIPVTVIAGILGLIGVGMAGYDAAYELLDRARRRRR
ncbi:hypothetical protein [Marinitenerispora sediminis]|uniref:Uncharacterized protein n=1 Tax=Marinitenerispora sediminis TaxID=1931232 RepID=A0A368T9C4_9ACTN|nr:hypothetical protein [Marinitenerispora sediminis]RCV52076.1 hypothetical protein DEF28_13985 [Marinitenerispora sediminis]RCV58095.1 hypothetical protein DEF23_09630 [Marinitenerispora sediminis]RCV60843.1 hypothetical protein DEF24_05900 [Marinitenerispora sediminis]